MALNRRGGLDPRWAFWGRESLAGYMPAQCSVYAPVAKGTPSWTPFDANPANRFPNSPNTHHALYIGPCRLVQYTGFRTKTGFDAGQKVSAQVVTVQLATGGNTVAGHTSYELWEPITPGCFVTVTNIAGIEGVPQSNAVLQFDYYVKIVNESSSRMTKDLVCDIVTESVGGPRGNL